MLRYYKNKKKVLYERNYYLISINCYLKKHYLCGGKQIYGFLLWLK